MYDPLDPLDLLTCQPLLWAGLRTPFRTYPPRPRPSSRPPYSGKARRSTHTSRRPARHKKSTEKARDVKGQAELPTPDRQRRESRPMDRSDPVAGVSGTRCF